MEIILEELQKKKCWKSALKTQCRRNSIDPTYASCFTIVKIRKFFQNPPQIQLSEKPRMKSSVWLENQLKAFQWLLICLSTVKGLLIKHFVRHKRVQSQREWTELSSIFNKDERVLEYEALKLVNEKQGSKRKWEQEQSGLLTSIITEEPESNKWNQIARKLFVFSDKKYFRTGKQCRERWFNHLDPSKKKGQWNSSQDIVIAKYILSRGKKWSDIAKNLENQRTEHMIKNRFKTLMIKLRKEYPDIINQNEILRKFVKQEKIGIFIDKNEREKQVEQLQAKHQKIEKNLQDKRHFYEELDLEGLPIEGADGLDGFDLKEQELMDRINPSHYKDLDLQQVMTPCPILYQSFTPTFLNTPHPMPFLCSFGKNDNLFLKNN